MIPFVLLTGSAPNKIERNYFGNAKTTFIFVWRIIPAHHNTKVGRNLYTLTGLVKHQTFTLTKSFPSSIQAIIVHNILLKGGQKFHSSKKTCGENTSCCRWVPALPRKVLKSTIIAVTNYWKSMFYSLENQLQFAKSTAQTSEHIRKANWWMEWVMLRTKLLNIFMAGILTCNDHHLLSLESLFPECTPYINNQKRLC